MFNVGSQELLIIFFVVLLLFGAKRVPEIARAFGQGMRDLRKAMSGIENELKLDLDEPRPKRPGGGTASLPAPKRTWAPGAAAAPTEPGHHGSADDGTASGGSSGSGPAAADRVPPATEGPVPKEEPARRASGPGASRGPMTFGEPEAPPTSGSVDRPDDELRRSSE